MKKILLSLFLTVLFVFNMSAQTNDEILSLLKENVDLGKLNQSISIAVIDENGTRFVNYGKISQATNAANADEHTFYEIGSITKPFTGILLAEAIKRGEVKADDPISKFLPKNVKTPTRNGKEITLIDLATHTSSLPRMPDNFDYSKNPFAVYDQYTVKDLYDFLAKVQLTQDIGTKYDYSNIGMGLLGYILSLRANTTFEKLVKQRIFIPLKMTESTIFFNKKQLSKAAQGYDDDLEPAPTDGNSPVFLGAGAIRSTASDMAKFVSANLGLTKTSISDSIEASQKPNRGGDNPKVVKTGYGWNVYDIPNYGKFVAHSGATAGFSSTVVFDRERKRGVVALSNTFSQVEVLAFHIFDKKFKKPKIVPYLEVSATTLEKYVGVYELTPEILMTVTRKGQKLYAQVTDQENVRVYAKTEKDFYYRVVEASLTFNADESGKIVSLTLHQGGDTVAKKIK